MSEGILRLEPRLADPDAAHALLVATLEAAPEEARLAVAVKLALLLANHVGDLDALAEACRIAARR